MGKSNKKKEFLEYLNTPLKDSVVTSLYDNNNIDKEYCLLFRDYVISVITLVFDTYLGDDIMTEEDKCKHFKWCWFKVMGEYKENGLDIGDNPDLYGYFSEFMRDTYYNSIIKDEELQDNIKKLWNYMFKHDAVKSRSDVDTVIELYNLFKTSLKVI